MKSLCKFYRSSCHRKNNIYLYTSHIRTGRAIHLNRLKMPRTLALNRLFPTIGNVTIMHLIRCLLYFNLLALTDLACLLLIHHQHDNSQFELLRFGFFFLIYRKFYRLFSPGTFFVCFVVVHLLLIVCKEFPFIVASSSVVNTRTK